MSVRVPLSLVLLLTAACESPGAADRRGTIGEPLQVQLNVQGLGQELSAQTQSWGGIPLTIKGVPGTDLTYRTELKVGDAQQLVVTPARGEPITFTGKPLRADFYHVGRVLVVQEGEGDALTIHNFADPVRWSTAPRGK